MVSRKKLKIAGDDEPDHFESLPDDIVVSILGKLSSVADSPSDIVSLRLTCRRLNRLGFHPLVLSGAGAKALGIRARSWSESAHRFLAQCAAAGNLEACYILGMIRFYCLEDRESGASLMAEAAMGSHALSLYSLAVVHFNGSGCPRSGKNPRAGVALCARAACRGHVAALRELGHSLQDGYGVRPNLRAGRCLLAQANARELVSTIVAPRCFTTLQPLRHSSPYCLRRNRQRRPPPSGRVTASPFTGVRDVPVPDPHPANRFLLEWFGIRGGPPGPGLRMCRHAGCGRPETRPDEFRRCSVCNRANYCSRGCQALDWKTRHKAECVPGNIHGALDGDGNENGPDNLNEGAVDMEHDRINGAAMTH